MPLALNVRKQNDVENVSTVKSYRVTSVSVVELIRLYT